MRKFISFILIAIILLGLVGCTDPDAINSPHEIAGMEIGALFGTTSFRRANEMGTAVAFYSGAEMMRQLRDGEIDAVIMEQGTAIELVESTSGVRILSEPLVEYELRVAVALENVGLLNAVNNAIAELEANGTLAGLASKYFARGDFVYRMPPDIEWRPGYLTVALPPDSPPFSFMDEAGIFTGMDVEVAIAISHIIGIELRPLEQDAREVLTAVWHGRADIALGWPPDEGEGIVNMSDPYASAVHVVIVRR